MADWTDFEARLLATFRIVSDRVFLIVASEADPTRYVQFAVEADRLRAEAPGVDVVADADESVLRAAGWQAPAEPRENWTSTLDLPALTAEYADLAARCVAALRDGYRVADPDELGYRAWRDPEQMPAGETWSDEEIARLDSGADPLDLPTLGLAAN